MSAPEHDALIDKTAKDIKAHHTEAVQEDIHEVLARDTNRFDPANEGNARLLQDENALRAKTGLSPAALQKLGFPDPLIENAVRDIQARDAEGILIDLIHLLARDGKGPGSKQLKEDHRQLHDAGMNELSLVNLGFPMPDKKKEQH